MTNREAANALKLIKNANVDCTKCEFTGSCLTKNLSCPAYDALVYVPEYLNREADLIERCEKILESDNDIDKRIPASMIVSLFKQLKEGDIYE